MIRCINEAAPGHLPNAVVAVECAERGIADPTGSRYVALSVCTTRDIRRGEEVTTSYGPSYYRDYDAGGERTKLPARQPARHVPRRQRGRTAVCATCPPLAAGMSSTPRCRVKYFCFPFKEMILSFDIGIKNLAFCRRTSDGESFRGRALGLYPRRADRAGHHRRARRVPDLLDDVDVVLIEKQMRANVRMSFVAAAIEMYVHLRARLFRSVRVIRVPAWRRTAVTSGARCSYSQRKRDSVDAALRLVAGSAWGGTLTAARKRDDLADCLCQAQCHAGFSLVR